MTAATNISYRVDLCNVSEFTAEDKSAIDSLMQAFFAELGLVFEADLDSDFLNAEKYYGPNSRGAYAVVRKIVKQQQPLDAKNNGGGDEDKNTETEAGTAETTTVSVVGTVGIKNITDAEHKVLGRLGSVAELKRFYVAEADRGGGRGKQLWLAILAAAQKLKYDYIVLDTKSRLEAANNFYAKLGFVDIEDYNGNWRADKWMALNLNQQSKSDEKK